ncbi:unnamed protein product [Lactuca saligna]|uniref:Uncharacterized protein n=1 Tax=Lactuca saligna TaxID=75948 RepID=A0AA35VV02_LACSI|nr:unnamed protein product [Lactuca saligna]
MSLSTQRDKLAIGDEGMRAGLIVGVLPLPLTKPLPIWTPPSATPTIAVEKLRGFHRRFCILLRLLHPSTSALPP